MHDSSCPSCGAASDGSTKSCGACGAVSLSPFLSSSVFPISHYPILSPTLTLPCFLHPFIHPALLLPHIKTSCTYHITPPPSTHILLSNTAQYPYPPPPTT
ncbi:hypothetical protein B0J18DRAFT_432286 [Chaetomium sp. MPI-SDFR-AT-0129]|nr:hypothetical protein B0J18DRAFT_432286 [Chaetomium sp. MPI-SDFR-AT-0129]